MGRCIQCGHIGENKSALETLICCLGLNRKPKVWITQCGFCHGQSQRESILQGHLQVLNRSQRRALPLAGARAPAFSFQHEISGKILILEDCCLNSLTANRRGTHVPLECSHFCQDSIMVGPGLASWCCSLNTTSWHGPAHLQSLSKDFYLHLT